VSDPPPRSSEARVVPIAPPPPRPLAPWWARLAIGAGAGTLWARAAESLSPRGVGIIATAIPAVFVLTSIAELARPSYRRRVPLATTIAAALAVAFAVWLDRLFATGEPAAILVFVGIPAIFGVYALAESPPASGGGVRVSRGGLRDLWVPLATLAAMLCSCVGTGIVMNILEVRSAYRRGPGGAALEGVVIGAAVGGIASFALQAAAWLVARGATRASPGAVAPPPLAQSGSPNRTPR
jgi:hypothetical protein